MAANEGSKTENPRVMMWCVFRSVSTAMSKCLSHVDGAEVWIEPYNMAKAAEDTLLWYDKDASLPLEVKGNEETYRQAAEGMSMGGDLAQYKLELLSPVTLKKEFDSISPSKKFVFIKDMAVGMPPVRYKYLPNKASGFRYLFLIRHPVKVYTSYRKVLLKSMLDVPQEELPPDYEKPDPAKFHCVNDFPPPKDGTPYFFKALNDLWKHVKATYEPKPLILDIDDLLADPPAMMPRLCSALGIPYSPSILQWDSSLDVIAKWNHVCPDVSKADRLVLFLEGAMKSSCFLKPSGTTSLDGATADVKEIVGKEMPFYEEMYKERFTV